MTKLLEERGLDPVVIHLKVDYNKVISRISGRRQCPECGTIYSLGSNPPKVTGICDKDGVPLVAREDDSELVVGQRLEEYEVQTRPLLEYFNSAGIPSHEVDGSEGSPLVIGRRICELIRQGK